MIELMPSSRASLISTLLTVTVLGNPVTRSLPRISAYISSGSGHAEPRATLTSSAVVSPKATLYSFFTYWVIASSRTSPPTRADWFATRPPKEMTATSVVPPPMSTIMLPCGDWIGRPAPIAAAIGSSMMNAGFRAPAYSAASWTARCSTPVIPDGTHITIRGLAHRLPEI